MSWIFGYIGKNAKSKLKVANEFVDQKLFQKITDEYFFYAGGNKRTIIFNETDSTSFSIFAGIGIVERNGSYGFLNSSDLTRLTKSDYTSEQLNGHFVAVIYSKNKLKVFTDKLGLRDIYYCETDDGLFLSTRIDWLKHFSKLEINASKFGSRWMTFHQLNLKSILKGCTRIVSGNSIEYEVMERKLTTNPFPLEYDELNQEFNQDEFEKKLIALSTFPAETGENLTLSLSGGTDSRLLLSLLLNQKKSGWDTHTFGDSSHPDALIAKKLADDLGFEHRMLQQDIPSFDRIYNELKEYTAITLVNNPASAILQLRNYHLIDNNNSTIIDGCIGEIWRREFLYKLQLKGAKAIKNKNTAALLSNVFHFRADVFNVDFINGMNSGINEEINLLFDQLPNPNEIGVLNWIDYFAIKTRFPNYFGPEQNYNDSSVVSYMPFIQLTLIQMLFGLREKLRRNGKFFKEIISKFDNRLTNYNLVKGIFNVPFKSNSLQSRLITFSKRTFSKKRYVNENQTVMLTLFKEYLRDRVNSITIANEYYDHQKVNNLISKYYSGQTELGNQLDWLLSFEILTEIIESK